MSFTLLRQGLCGLLLLASTLWQRLKGFPWPFFKVGFEIGLPLLLWVLLVTVVSAFLVVVLGNEPRSSSLCDVNSEQPRPNLALLVSFFTLF